MYNKKCQVLNFLISRGQLIEKTSESDLKVDTRKGPKLQNVLGNFPKSLKGREPRKLVNL
jgi:hypothetical protein